MRDYKCLPYIMRFNRYEESPYRGVYVTLARWCNQPSFFKKKSFREFSQAKGNDAAARYLDHWLSAQKMTPIMEVDKRWAA